MKKEREISYRKERQEISKLLKAKPTALEKRKEDLQSKRFAPSPRFVSHETKPRNPSATKKDYLKESLANTRLKKLLNTSGMRNQNEIISKSMRLEEKALRKEELAKFAPFQERSQLLKDAGESLIGSIQTKIQALGMKTEGRLND